MIEFSKKSTEAREEEKLIIATCVYVQRLTECYERISWPGNLTGKNPALDALMSDIAARLYQDRAALLDHLAFLIVDMLPDEGPAEAFPPTLQKLLLARIDKLETALKPFAAIHERRNEGGGTKEVASSPAACDARDCAAAWLALFGDDPKETKETPSETA